MANCYFFFVAFIVLIAIEERKEMNDNKFLQSLIVTIFVIALLIVLLIVLLIAFLFAYLIAFLYQPLKSNSFDGYSFIFCLMITKWWLHYDNIMR